jgi:flavodoxin
MNILVTYFSQTQNTAKIAHAIYEEAKSHNHRVDLKKVTHITANNLNAYNLVFVGSACHDTDLAKPVKRLLEAIHESPPFKLAGFVTHATQMPEDGQRAKALYEDWAGNCILTFQRICEEKQITFLGFFHCQGAPSRPIEAFIHSTIITGKTEWKKYLEEVRCHPKEADLQAAKTFAHQILHDCQ